MAKSNGLRDVDKVGVEKCCSSVGLLKSRRWNIESVLLLYIITSRRLDAVKLKSPSAFFLCGRVQAV